MASNIPSILKGLFFVLIILNIKSFPLVYHAYDIPLRITVFKNKDVNVKRKDLFRIIESKNIVLFDDIDANLHMNNSSYNKVLDHARGDFIAAVFAKVMWSRNPAIVQKSVLTIFNHEIPPFSNYSIHTKILTWDQKWLLLASYYRLHKTNKITSLAISKCIFKEANGRTIKPEEIFEISGYLENESEEEKEERENIRQKGMKFAEGIYSAERLLDEEIVRELNLKDKVPAKL